MHPPHGRSRMMQAGFTLLELILVLFIVGLGSLLAVASLDRIAVGAGERQWSDRTWQSLKRLRQHAVTQGEIVQATLDVEGGTLIAVVGSTAVDVRLDLPEGFRFAPGSDAAQEAPSGPIALRFYPDGSAQSQRFALHMPSGASQLFAISGLSGRIWRGEFDAAER